MKLPRLPVVRCKSMAKAGRQLAFAVTLLANQVSAADCQLSLSQPRVDYGVLRHAQLLDDHWGSPSLGKRTVLLNVICIDPVPMAVRFSGLPAGPQGFRFGGDGAIVLSVRHAQLDGRAVDLLAEDSMPGAPRERLLPGQVLIARAAGGPVAGRLLSVQLDIAPNVPMSVFSVRGETTLEGRVQIEWVPREASASTAVAPGR
ncbi:hypothetical protein [Pseudomonas fluorescens]|nr:hypothetical protein [Pseudomonas fluorescens]